MALPDLEAAYLDPSTPIYTGTTEALLKIDGIEYFQAIHDAIDRTGPGDAIYILNWMFDRTMDPLVPPPAAPRSPIGDQLVRKAAAGVDVRLVLNGRDWGAQTPGIGRPYEQNLDSIEALRTMTAGSGGPPMANRMLYDFSGANMGSHHQKATVVKVGAEVLAFIGGMDYYRNRLDSIPYSTQHYPDGNPWGWHDAGVQLRGLATRGAWANFASRWYDAATLPERRMLRYRPLRRPLLNPANPVSQQVPVSPPVAPVASPEQSVQVLRSRYELKLPNLISGGSHWRDGPPGGIYQVHATLRRAIGAAQRFIYIEDQFLDDSPLGDSHRSLLSLLHDAAARGVKVILFGSGRTDPADARPGLTNRSLNSGITHTILHGLSPAQQANVAVWRLENVTVHAKLMIIDDCFLAVGSANLHSRSMAGVDDELHVAIVDAGHLISDFRVRLWGQHLRVPSPAPPTVTDALRNLDVALGIWRNRWMPAGTDPSTWTIADHPSGFTPQHAIAFVGPTL